MARNTIGQFIAALRKANGLTQQEVADRLNVSNKAVSRWERDECAPDLSLIPALAEMFGVTCDELLKGERIPEASAPEKREPKTEKQVRVMINRTLSSFRSLIWISLTVAIVGLICMFGISYGFYRPVIGFAVMLLFEACAFVIAVCAVNRAKEVTTDNELFEEADPVLTEKFSKQLGSYSFAAFSAIVATILISLPLILWRSDYVDSVLSVNTYFACLPVVVIVLALVYLKSRYPYTSWVTNGKIQQNPTAIHDKRRKQLSLIQISLTIIATALFVFAPYLLSGKGADTAYVVLILIGLALLLANIICFVVFLVREKDNRKQLIIPGVRNILLIPSALIGSEAHNVSWSYGPGDIIGQRHDTWSAQYLLYAVALAAFVFLLFAFIEAIQQKEK